MGHSDYNLRTSSAAENVITLGEATDEFLDPIMEANILQGLFSFHR